ncbi:helix-turn-helix domain-containing protein [Flavobacteriaceae bacterium R38]|nr:helix-turn-helix domain-containing protein [Flavobacteriaceae bacterium R38]
MKIRLSIIINNDYLYVINNKLLKLPQKTFKIWLIFTVSLNFTVLAQEDSLKNKDYQYLFKRISEFYDHDIEKTKLYTHVYLEKAKKDNDSLKITQALYYLSQKNDYEKSLQYIDSAFTYYYTPLKNKYHLFLHYHAGYIHYGKGKYKEAIDSYLAAKKLIHLSESKILHSGIEYNIGLVRLRIGEFNKAIKIFKTSYDDIIENNLESEYSEIYLRNLAALSTTYWYLKKIDSATYYNSLSINKAIKYNNYHRYNKSRVTQAIINYSKNNYKNALDSITKYAPLIQERQDSLDLAITYFYKGKAFQKLNDWENAIIQFKKVDTIIQKNKRYTQEIEENYEILKNYYKNKEDIDNYTLYLERLIDFDSIKFNISTYLKNELLEKYDAPKWIEEKEALITKLESKDSKKSKILFYLSTLSILLILLLFYYYTKKQRYKKRFEKIIANTSTSDLRIKTKSKRIKKELNLPDTIVKDILMKIQVFEKENQFLNNTITLNSLAKKLGTNSAYLSKIINFHKDKNFSTYLTDLRINYVIQALKEQPKLREYTIKAIAFEVGFKNSESFTTAFYKKTKIYPSYFIKELQKKEKSA